MVSTYPLPRPFLVMATQNPIEYEGTFPLPEAQLDRFLIKLKVGYPSIPDERKLLTHLSREHPVNHLLPVQDAAQLLDLQHQVWDIHVDESLQEYIVQLVERHAQPSRSGLGRQPASQSGTL